MSNSKGAVAMALMIWGEKFIFGISQIDRQHKALFDLLNQVHAVLAGQVMATNLGEILAELFASVDSHFRTEERLMRAHNYEGHAAHEAAHLSITTKIQEFQKDVQAGKALLTIETLGVFKGLLEKHILDVDRQYQEFFVKKGVQ
jgi:hemerythrin